MSEPISAREFHLSEGVGDWRVIDGGACARYGRSRARCGSASGRVFVRLFTTAPAPEGLSILDLDAARLISGVAKRLGLTAEPSEVHNVLITIDALDIPKVFPFWQAVLGYDAREGGPVDELNDPRRRKPIVCFQQMDAPRPQRNRIHLDIWVPHEEAENRIAAALAAGGRIVSDEPAPSWWVLARPRGQRGLYRHVDGD